jgi:5-methylcytosine-specific restriction endonuclease McrA
MSDTINFVNNLQKICSKCKESLSLSSFSCTKRNEDGVCLYYNSWCNSCRTKNNRLRLGLKERPKALITESGKECLKCNIVKPFEEFSPSERGKLNVSAYCKSCTPRATNEYSRLQTSKYREANRERYLAQHRINMFNRRNKVKAQSDGSITDEFLKFLYQQEYCCWCNEHVIESSRTLEHIIELSNGGLHSITNVAMSCFSCNSRRLNKNNNNPCESLFTKFIERSL